MTTALFIRFLNKEVSVGDLLSLYAKSSDSFTSQTAIKAQENPPDLSSFHKELKDAVSDIIAEGLAEEFASFANNYMESSLVEDVESFDSTLGQNVSRMARVRDAESPWIEGLLCYNLCLYIKAYGLDSLKKCRVCGKFFDHKGKYAIYCSDACKSTSKIKDSK
jgi:hypothetical protein